MSTRLLAIVLAVLVAGTRAGAAPLAVPLTVNEPADVARRAFPATASVPLLRGPVHDPAAVWLAAPDGRPAPLQARALERWPDGSVRWLLLDFLADVPAGGHATYTLRDGKPPAAGSPARIRMQARDGARVIDAGPLHATIPDGGEVLWSELVVGDHRLGALPLPALVVDGSPAGPPVPDRMRIETDGPVRTELLLTGRYPAGITYEMRVAFFAGQPLVRVEHTITSVVDQPYLPVRSLALAVERPFQSAALGLDGSRRVFSTLERPHALRQTEAASTVLDDTSTGRHGDGWARASGDGLAVTLVTPYFWQEYPKAFTVTADRLSLDLLAGASAPVQFGSGAAKTHEVWLVVEPAATAHDAAALARALNTPLVALPPAAWIAASRALPQALAPDSPAARDFLTRLSAAYARYRAHVATEHWDDGPIDACDGRPLQHPRVGFYGVLNWGDWRFPGFRPRTHGCESWGNLEYDLPQVLALAYASTGSRDFFDGLVPAARHYRDIDVIHHAPGHPEWVGMNHPHKWHHFSFETAERIDLGHTWTEGLVTYYRLTGEVRALEAARGIADALVWRVAKAHNPRQFGWPMIAIAGVYDATGEARYRDALRDYASAAMDAFRPTPAAGDWKMGILADGLADAHAATGDDRIRHWLVDYAEALLAAPGRYPDPRYALPLGYLTALTGDVRYATRARAVADGLKLGAWGKPLAAMGRTGFRLLAPLALARTAPPPRASSPPRPAPARPTHRGPRSVTRD